MRHSLAAPFLLISAFFPFALPAETALVCAAESAPGNDAYREIRRFEKAPITNTHIEERTETVFTTVNQTEFQNQTRTVWVPITEYQYQPSWPNWLNPFAPTTSAYGLKPVTRWEARTEVVPVPVTVQKIVPETKIVRVPVRSLGFVQREVIERVPVDPLFVPSRSQNPTVIASQPVRTPGSNFAPRQPEPR